MVTIQPSLAQSSPYDAIRALLLSSSAVGHKVIAFCHYLSRSFSHRKSIRTRLCSHPRRVGRRARIAIRLKNASGDAKRSIRHTLPPEVLRSNPRAAQVHAGRVPHLPAAAGRADNEESLTNAAEKGFAAASRPSSTPASRRTSPTRAASVRCITRPSGRTACVELLLAAGADPNRANHAAGLTPPWRGARRARRVSAPAAGKGRRSRPVRQSRPHAADARRGQVCGVSRCC